MFRPVNDLRLSSAQEMRDLRNELLKLPLTPLKKEVLDSVFQYCIDRAGNDNLLKLLFTDFDGRQDQITTIINALKVQRDDQFLQTVKSVMNRLPHGSDLKNNMEQAITHAQQELIRRREALHSNALTAAVASTAILLVTRPVAGVVLLAGELLMTVNFDVKSLLDQALEIYDSTGFADIKGEETNQVERRLVTSYPH